MALVLIQPFIKWIGRINYVVEEIHWREHEKKFYNVMYELIEHARIAERIQRWNEIHEFIKSIQMKYSWFVEDKPMIIRWKLAPGKSIMWVSADASALLWDHDHVANSNGSWKHVYMRDYVRFRHMKRSFLCI